MSRLTDPLSTKCSMSPWDWCGLDSVCKRDCFKPEPCKIPMLARRLAEYEDVLCATDGTEIISLDRLREIVEAEKDDRLIIRPNCLKCDRLNVLKYDEPCFECYGQDRYGSEKGFYFKPRTEAEAALEKKEGKENDG